ncbi:hypothetical protein [Fontivita pretiosa]|jgi:hypothetical protein|uniref:hypothetical protein n=1 Tax=Fontivita pretiosa TaxID=2989684 RepID=UPI003D17BF9B
MSDNSLLGLGAAMPLKPDSSPANEYVMIQRPLQRVLAFTGRTIDDVINDPIARNEVIGYYKLYRWVQRECEVIDLERQWNPLGG